MEEEKKNAAKQKLDYTFFSDYIFIQSLKRCSFYPNQDGEQESEKKKKKEAFLVSRRIRVYRSSCMHITCRHFRI